MRMFPGMRGRSIIVLLAVVLCVVDAWTQEATWTTYGFPRGAEVHAYATASPSIDYCIAGPRLYRRVDRGPWKAWADTSTLSIGSQVSAWEDTVVVLSIDWFNGGRLFYSHDAGVTWTSISVPYTIAAILPHTSSYVALSEPRKERGIVRCVDYGSGRTTSISVDVSETSTGPHDLLATDGHVMLRSGYTDTSLTWVKVYHLRPTGTDASSWDVQRDSAKAGPFMVHGGGIALLEGRRLLHFHRASIDTIVLPERHGVLAHPRNGSLHYDGIQHFHGAWLIRMMSSTGNLLATSLDGMNWSPYEHSIPTSMLEYATLWTWTGRRIVFETRNNALWEHDAPFGTTSSIKNGLFHRGIVATDGRFIVVYTPNVERDNVIMHVLDDSVSPPAINEYTVPVARMRLLSVTHGIAWIAGDSLHAIDLRLGLALPTLPLPSTDLAPSSLVTSRHQQYLTTREAVYVRKHTESTWRTVFSVRPTDRFRVVDVCPRRNGLYILIDELTNFSEYKVRLAKISFTGVLLLEPVLLDSYKVKWDGGGWELEDLGLSVAVIKHGYAKIIADDDGTAFQSTHLDRPSVAMAGRVWVQTPTEIVATALTDREARGYIVPPIQIVPYARWFCGPNRCYVNDIHGLRSANFDTLTTSAPEQQTTAVFRIDMRGSVHTSIEGQLTIADIQGRTVVTQHVTPGTFSLPAMARGVYAAVLVGVDGDTHYSMFCSPELQAR
jgi:hypothetical protein